MNMPRQFLAALGAALALGTIAPATAASADAPSGSPGEADAQCLACHGAPGLSKTLASGEPLALHLDGAAFAKSVHASLGCSACHAGVDPQKHPDDAKPPRGAREFSVAMTQACRGCHEATFEAHAASVHGRAEARGEAGAPLCTTCHGVHDIAPAAAGPALREACLSCHADAPAAHDQWLPNTRLHLQVVSCAACHAPASGKRVELRFYDVATKRERVTDGRVLAATANPGGDGVKPIDAAALRELVRTIDRGGSSGDVVLLGRVEPADGAEGHRLLPKSRALKDCAVCHRKGADPFQKVSLSVLEPGGERVLYEARQDVLHSPTSVESVRAFYAMGGTRIQILDVVLALALVGGICAPLGHLLVRQLMRRKDRHHE